MSPRSSIDPDRWTLNWWPHNSVSPGVPRHLTSVNLLVITSRYRRLNEQIRHPAAMKWTHLSSSQLKYAQYSSTMDTVYLHNLGVFIVPLPADGIIIEYDNDREDCKFILEAPTTPLVSPSYPQSNGQSSDLDPPSPPMFREGGSPTGSRINWISSLLRSHRVIPPMPC